MEIWLAISLCISHKRAWSCGRAVARTFKRRSRARLLSKQLSQKISVAASLNELSSSETPCRTKGLSEASTPPRRGAADTWCGRHVVRPTRGTTDAWCGRPRSTLHPVLNGAFRLSVMARVKLALRRGQGAKTSVARFEKCRPAYGPGGFARGRVVGDTVLVMI